MTGRAVWIHFGLECKMKDAGTAKLTRTASPTQDSSVFGSSGQTGLIT